MILQELYEAGYSNTASENYVWLPEFEWLSPEKMQYYREKLYPELKNVIPFAINTGGDFYGLYSVGADEQLVIFYTHDSGQAVYFAKSVQAAVFHQIIRFTCGDYVDMCTDEEKEGMNEEEAEDYISESEAVEMLHRYCKTYGRFFPECWTDKLMEIADGGFLDGNAFIPYEEGAGILYDLFGREDNLLQHYSSEELGGTA